MPGYAAVLEWSRGDHADAPRVVGDVRLDEEADLARALGTADRGLALVGRAYARWGAELAPKLRGDFAVVILDPARGVICAARDRLGVKPLAYRRTRRGVAIASDVGALAVLEGGSPLDDETVEEFLRGPSGSHSRTFFRGVSRLPPGHVLVLTPHATSLRRYWFPPERVRAEGHEASVDGVRARLERAVDLRICGDAPVLVHASGGIDSSAITSLARSLRGDREPRIHFVAGAFAEADERAFVAALARHIDAPIELVDGAPTGDLDEPFDRADPGRYCLSAFLTGIEAIAVRTGARAVLSGVGGDELFFERGIFRDLARRADRRAPSRGPVRARVLLALRAVLPARRAPRARTALPRARRSARPSSPPRRGAPWLRPRRAAAPPTPPELAGWPWSSHTQCITWEWLTSPRLVAALEAAHRANARAGLEMRYPFLDTALVEWVLATPYASRVPRGRMKALLRDALAGALPAAIRERSQITPYDGAIVASVVRKLPALRDVIERGPWCSDPYVDRAAARHLARQLAAAPADVDLALGLWDVVALEEWLRRLG